MKEHPAPSIDQGIGQVDLDGSINVSPPSTTTYTITGDVLGMSVTDSTVVTVCKIPEVTLHADQESICITESATLTWTSINAESCIIEPGIGEVEPNGSITVTPFTDTVYTITATGDCSATSTSSATITIEPTCDNDGDGLPDLWEWNHFGSLQSNANDDYDSDGLSNLNEYLAGTNPCDPDTDNDGMNDGWEVQYGLNSLENDADVDFDGDGVSNYEEYSLGTDPTLPVFVSISALPDDIFTGETSTLSWTSVNATSVTIQGIGSVDLNGSMSVSPVETRTYTIEAEGQEGTETASITVTVRNIMISIDSPEDGDVLQRPDTILKGSIINPLDLEAGITVNGVSALVYGSQFAANHVSLEQGLNEITAFATDSSGTAESTSIEVFSEPENDYIRITPDEESGVAPFETILKLDATFDITEEPYITYTGPGVMDIVRVVDEYNYTVSSTTPGLYFITAEVENGGSAYTDTIAILVMDEVALDAMLQAKWNGMKAALIDGDIEDAASYFINEKRDLYIEFLQLIPNDQVNDLIPSPDRMEWIGYTIYGARYVADIDIIANGEEMTISSYIDFEQDSDGIWRISGF